MSVFALCKPEGYIALAVLLLWVLACGGSTPTPATGPAINISAEALYREYDANEIAADQRYKNATLAISGVIDDIGKDIAGSPYLTLKASDLWSVQAMFPRESAGTLAGLNKGASVTVRCRGAGKLGNVIVRDCVLAK